MLLFKDFASYNEYVGLAKPLDNDINIGYYDKNSRLQSEPVKIDFYRISIKSNLINRLAPEYDPEDPQPVRGVFFMSPEHSIAWNTEKGFTGMYIQVSKKIIEENRHLFQNYLGYGEHDALLITDTEEQEIRTIFDLLSKSYHDKKDNHNILLSYIHVLISLVESYYHRQFNTEIKKYNHIVSEFHQLVNEYYNDEMDKLPTVQYFAEKMGLSPNYLGDIVKYFTNKSAIDTIHSMVINKAKIHLRQTRMNISEVAYELGFEYSNYFAKFFKRHTQLTPREYRNRAQLQVNELEVDQ